MVACFTQCREQVRNWQWGLLLEISVLIGTTIAGIANKDIQRWSDIASLTGLVFGSMVIGYFLRFSGIINFLSDNVLVRV